MKKGYGKAYGGIGNETKGGRARGRGNESSCEKTKASPQPNYKSGKYGKN